MYVNATDLDDPTTLNGQLFYEIIIQLPKINNVMYFQINNKTGAISLTQQGRSSDALKRLSESGKGTQVRVTLGDISFSLFSYFPQDLRNWIPLRMLSTVWWSQ